MQKVRWGILSTAKIGTLKVIPAMQLGQHSEVVAIGSRSAAAAGQAAAALGIARSHGSYEALLADPQVEAVYNPLPNHLHVPWSIKALEAGKHVLCEKPIALTAAEGQLLVDAGRRHPHLKLMEAFMYRHHPQWLRAQELVRAGGNWHAAHNPFVLLVSQRGRAQHPQHGGHWRRRPNGHRLLQHLAGALYFWR